MFKGLTGLQKLGLSGSIKTILMDTFKGLTGQHTLYLSGNSISTHDMSTFKGLTNYAHLIYQEIVSKL